MFEMILDKIDEWNSRLYDWQRTSDSRAFLAFCLHGILLIPFAIAIILFLMWTMGALLGI